MPRPLVAVVAGLASVLLAVVMVVGTRVVIGSTRWLETRQELGCEQDTTASGYQGWCLERVSRPEVLVVPGKREIHVVAQVDGGAGRYLYNEDPFAPDADLTTRLTDSELRIVDPNGTALVISRERISSLAD